MTDDFARWAVRRADDLIARAEAEVVAELKAVLLRAAESAVSSEVPAPGIARKAPRESTMRSRRVAEPIDDTALLWAYCVIREDSPSPDELPGLGGSVERIEHAGLAALVSRVPAAEYGADVLPESLNDMPRLLALVRAHEAVLERVAEHATIVPLRICTIFVDNAGVRRMLARDQAALEQALARLHGREEWAVKLLLDEQRPGVEADMAASSPSGAAYLEQRRAERERRTESERLGRELAEDVHARLQDWAIDAVVNPPQNPELSGHEGVMLLNGAYLVDSDRADELRRLVAELQERHGPAGARLELTGPLPPFNFVTQPDAASSP